MKWKSLFIVAALFILATPVVAQDTATTEISTVTGVATDEGIDLPGEISAGYVNLTFENNRTESAFSPIVARLNDGVTMDDFMSTMSGSDEMAAISLVTLYGGSQVAAGESLSYTTKLIPGEYLLLETAGEGFASFTVTDGDTTDTAEPEVDVNLILIDFAFGVPAFVPAGSQVWHIEDLGDQWHEMVMIPLPEGMSSVADVRAAMEAGDQPEIQPAFFWAPMSPGIEAWVTLDLEPGNYVLLCFLPDIAGDFSPHIAHGMMQVFTVE